MILFEAGEIEYTRCFKDSHNLSHAYTYYKKAQELGYPLADWALGYLLEHNDAEKIGIIDDFVPLDKDKRIEAAVQLYFKSASKGCSKALNSLGNALVKGIIPASDLEFYDSAKNYYKGAAEADNIFGMNNYACLLEKELFEMKSNHDDNYLIAHRNDIQKIGKEMIHFFEKSAELGYDKSCLKTALYYGHFNEESEIVEFRSAHIFLVKSDIDKALLYLRKCLRSANKNIASKAGYYLARHLIESSQDSYAVFPSENLLQDIKQLLVHISNLDASQSFQDKIQRLMDNLQQYRKHQDAASAIVDKYIKQ